MCSDCQRKDKIIDSLKSSVKDGYKQGRLETVEAIFADVQYPSAYHKQQVIQDLVDSGAELDLIRSIGNDLKRTQGLHHKHYS
jgi:hypothetical protein